MSTVTLFRYFDTLTPRQQKQFEQMGDVYTAWNKKINLISRKDIGHIYLKHVLHTLSIAKLIAFVPGTKVLDVGTGGGFPGIPLAIMFPEAQFYLIDTIGKKIHAVQDIVQQLGLTNVRLHQTRAENMQGYYEFILGRAVTNLSTFYDWVKHKISSHAKNSIPNGILYLKGVAPIPIPFQHCTYAIRDFFDEPFFEKKQLIHIMRAEKA